MRPRKTINENNSVESRREGEAQLSVGPPPGAAGGDPGR